MPVFLLDANVLIALAWTQHHAHKLVGHWFQRHSRSGWATCPFTESAFVRISSNPAFSARALVPRDAIALLKKNLELPNHEFWPANIGFLDAIRASEHRLTGHRQTTDAYLLGLAIQRGGKLATLDSGIAAWGPSNAVEWVR